MAPEGPPDDGSWGEAAAYDERLSEIEESPDFESWLWQTYSQQCRLDQASLPD